MDGKRRLSIDEQQIDHFFRQLKAPNNLETIREEVKIFCVNNCNQRIVLITSGGTTVPFERNTVRFVDNFSAGTRGSASAEYFLESGYSVIFLYRVKSLEPFARHFTVHDFFNAFIFDQNKQIKVSDELSSKLVPILERQKESKNRLLSITFTTLSEYLHLLREISLILQKYGTNVMLYLSAAVSDFYIPPEKMAVHKIQSSAGPLRFQFELVPKVLRPLVKFWVPNAYIISFKLETDESILLEKAREALNKYGHRLVIANELNTRKHSVTLVTDKDHQHITVSPDEDIEIEKLIVEEVIQRHDFFRNDLMK